MNWKIAYAPNCECKNTELKTIKEIKKSGFEIIDAVVPGCIEADLMRCGKLPDLYYSTNTLLSQKLENLHLWYYTMVEIENVNSHICFEGIDTIADIFVNGKLVKSVDNMFIPHNIYDCLKNGKNEIVVHIKPVCIETRNYISPAGCKAQTHNYPALHIRKAAHQFGWDIMPRIVSAGLWKDVKIIPNKTDSINELYFVTNYANEKRSSMYAYFSLQLEEDYAQDYSIKFEGKCDDSSFEFKRKLFHNSGHIAFSIDNAKLWWPKNAGKQNLYDTKVSLYYKDTLKDEYSLKFGIREINLEHTDITDNDGNGKFCFNVNGKEIFVLGTNWVPLDALHCNDTKRLQKSLELLDDIGCNMVRCWGGNVYESDEFYEFCDTHGIMIWQDFMFGCAVYPNDTELFEKIKSEAKYQIKRLRNHPSLALWAGDNECDLTYSWVGMRRDPNVNVLNRSILKQEVVENDYARDYLPSSPYVSQRAYDECATLPEEHLWGPRDYFKGDYYKNTFCHFASETGYHGFNSVSSLKKFLKEPEKIFKEEHIPTDEYLVHASCMDTNMDDPYAYRIELAFNQVITLFGSAEEDFSDFVKQSQISQAEAKKYFIEKFRIDKPKRSGIIWWNLIDGWPQVSDAIIDYYYNKKLAYSYIKRSQNPVCLMFDEPEGGSITLCGVNDTTTEKEVKYTVTDVANEQILLTGSTVIPTDKTIRLQKLSILETEKKFLLIEWECDGKVYKNHYFTNIINISYKDYLTSLKKCGFDEFED